MTIHKVGNKGGKILRSGLGKGLGNQNEIITYQVISLPPPDTLLAILQSKVLWGWSGDSATSNIKATGYSNLAMAGTPQSGVAKLGSALSYSGGNNSYSSFRINETLRTANAYTISCWCRWNSFNYGGPWGMYAAQFLSDNGIVTSTQNTGSSPSRLNFSAYKDNQSIVATAPSFQYLSVNTWYHLVYEINYTFFKLYINGVLENTSGTFPSGTDFWGSAQTFRLAGYAASVSATQLNGYLDEFYIIAGILSQDEIDYLYNDGNGRTLV